MDGGTDCRKVSVRRQFADKLKDDDEIGRAKEHVAPRLTGLTASRWGQARRGPAAGSADMEVTVLKARRISRNDAGRISEQYSTPR